MEMPSRFLSSQPDIRGDAGVPDGRELKACCASLYEAGIVRYLLGESFHPGGLALTGRLGEALGLGPADVVLDVACGQGASACYLAKTFGCRVVGVDLSEASLHHARQRAVAEGVADRVRCLRGDAERIPASDGQFTTAVCECSLCLFPDKPAALRDVHRALRPLGRIGITDVALDPERLPAEWRGTLSRAACLGDARPASEYRRLLQDAGFTDLLVEDHAAALREMAQGIGKRILLAKIAQGLGKLDPGMLDLDEALRVVKAAGRLIDDGTITYVLLTGVRP
ncbi:MAG: methyltransferase domain-containing protein [Armatimonadetes bacterium]|nr:methyltransferase domain-containing protein [Armatimonadota bacterium]